MLTTVHVWDALMDLVKGTGVYKDVRALPFQRVTDDRDLFDHLPDLLLPAAVVTALPDKIEGEANRRKDARWALLLVWEDLDGTAYREAHNQADALRLLLEAKDVESDGGEFRILGTSDASPVAGFDNKCLIEIEIATEQAEAR